MASKKEIYQYFENEHLFIEVEGKRYLSLEGNGTYTTGGV